MPTWTFVRHGQSRANAEGWLAGVFDSELTALGRQQARSAQTVVASLSFRRVLCSDLSRAHDTARLVLGDPAIGVLCSAQLRERHCGIYERRSIEELERSGQMGGLTRWEVRPPGGESLCDVAYRALRWLATEDMGEDCLVVAHGALIRAVIGVLDRTPVEDIGRWRPRNCEAVTRQVPTKTWSRLCDELITSSA